MDDVVEDIEFLARSEPRVHILRELAKEELSTMDLRERIDAHRTSISRNLDALLEYGWIHKTDDHYRIDPCGELIADDFLALAESVKMASRLQPFLRWIDTESFDFDLRLFRDAEIWTAEPGNPWAMVNQHVRRMKEINEGKILTPVAGLSAKEAVYERVMEHGASIDLIIPPHVFESYETDPSYSGIHEQLMDSAHYRYFVYEGEIPFYLGVIDGIVQIGVDEDGEPKALLESEHETVMDWAVRTLDGYKAESVVVTG